MDCDVDADQIIDYCEMLDCVVKQQNDYRERECPGFGASTCECRERRCEECWDCDVIKQKAHEAMAYYNTNGSWMINPQDNFEYDHYMIMTDSCDFDNDGSIDICEIEKCMV